MEESIQAQIELLKLQKQKLELELRIAEAMAAKSPKSQGSTKAKNVNGTLFVPKSKSGKDLVPLKPEDKLKFKLKRLQNDAVECRKQAQLLLEKAEIIDNEAKDLEDEIRKGDSVHSVSNSPIHNN